MTGDVADYYQGQSDEPVSQLEGDAEGYPYYGYRFENSPRKRRVEQGVPGKGLRDPRSAECDRGTATDGADCLLLPISTLRSACQGTTSATRWSIR